MGTVTTSLDAPKTPRRGIGWSIAGAVVLLAWDVILTGSFELSILVCPIWFVVSIVKNVIQRPGRRIALMRIAIPVVILALVLLNDTIQRGIAEGNAEKIIAACEKFHAENSRYPKTLDELVPQYLSSVPRAKYCMDPFGQFMYWNFEEDNDAALVWYVVPPFGRSVYNFKEQRWGYVD